MNDRMLELAIVAGLKKPPSSDREYIGDFDWRLFGELVIKECAYIVENSPWVLNRGYKAVDQADLVKQHFGVEV